MAARGKFSSKLGFIAAAAGSAVGLGNIWRFPYETNENGGAAFLLIYLACTLIIGLPIMLGEIALGRKTQMNAYGAYRKIGGKQWALVGLFGVLCGIMILSFYNVVAGWAFGYFVQIVFGDLLEQGDFSSFFGSYVSDVGDNLFYSLAFMGLTAVIVIRGVQKGIETASKILMPLLFLLLISLIAYGMTLDGAIDGVKFYLLPDLTKITGNTIYSAMGQAFFSLSLGMGALITYGSYINKNDNLVNSAIIVTIADVTVAFLAGLMIFPLIFSQNLEPSGGPGLVFQVLPGIFQQMGPTAGKVVGGSFFMLLCFAALTSTISLLEVPVSYMVDEKRWPRKTIVVMLALAVFVIGLPSMLSQGALAAFSEMTYLPGGLKGTSFLDMIAVVFSDIGLPLGGLLLTIFIAVKWKTSGLTDEVSFGFENYKGSFWEKYVNIMITMVCPLVLSIIFLFTVLEKIFDISIFS